MSFDLFMAIFMGMATFACISMMLVARKEGQPLGFAGFFSATCFALALMLGHAQKVVNPPDSQGSCTSVKI